MEMQTVFVLSLFVLTCVYLAINYKMRKYLDLYYACIKRKTHQITHWR